MEKTYVAVMNYGDENSLEHVFLLGWNNTFNCFDFAFGDELLTKDNNLKKHSKGSVSVGKDGFLYIEENKNSIENYAKSAKAEGYECDTCELYKDNFDKWKVKKVN